MERHIDAGINVAIRDAGILLYVRVPLAGILADEVIAATRELVLRGDGGLRISSRQFHRDGGVDLLLSKALAEGLGRTRCRGRRGGRGRMQRQDGFIPSEE